MRFGGALDIRLLRMEQHCSSTAYCIFVRRFSSAEYLIISRCRQYKVCCIHALAGPLSLYFRYHLLLVVLHGIVCHLPTTVNWKSIRFCFVISVSRPCVEVSSLVVEHNRIQCSRVSARTSALARRRRWIIPCCYCLCEISVFTWL